MSEPVVYAIRAGDLIKIGTTTDVAGRLKSLQTGNGAKLELIGTMAGDAQTELLLHGMFTHRRQEGEWFELEESDLAALQNILVESKVTRSHSARRDGESKFDRAERLYRCKSATTCSGERVQCHLWRGHWGSHQGYSHALGMNWDNPDGHEEDEEPS